jgi:predicted heme/steroid binding protein
MSSRKFTRVELSRYNGRNGAPSYVAFEGKVYDVTNSFHWQNGRHQVYHDAGTDLTDNMSEAPHDADVFNKFPVVGVLVEEKSGSL